ncbi:hypothetical protein LDL08_09910 [Nonomuraea glycinis]|nr:hypothetical protein [Nonomuraea glycinis]MCA2176497.1 hypothetical protein [Nonomuraea glycinis]
MPPIAPGRGAGRAPPTSAWSSSPGNMDEYGQVIVDPAPPDALEAALR